MQELAFRHSDKTLSTHDWPLSVSVTLARHFVSPAQTVNTTQCSLLVTPPLTELSSWQDRDFADVEPGEALR